MNKITDGSIKKIQADESRICNRKVVPSPI